MPYEQDILSYKKIIYSTILFKNVHTFVHLRKWKIYLSILKTDIDKCYVITNVYFTLTILICFLEIYIFITVESFYLLKFEMQFLSDRYALLSP